MNSKLTKLFLRLALALGFLSAVADRFGFWAGEISVWGNWENFLAYTQLISPWFPESWVPILGALATGAEILFALGLILGLKTELIAKLSGILLLVFGLSMSFSTGIKGALDFSVFAAAGAAFALSLIKEKFLELDQVLGSSKGLAS